MMSRYEQLVGQAPDGIVVHDGERILEVNDAMVRMIGVNHREQLVGQPVSSVLGPPYLKAIEQRLLDTRSAPSTTIREHVYRIDGAICEVEVHAQLFLDGGRPAVHLVLRDLTALLKREREQEAERQQAHLRQQAGEIQALAGGVAHELNNMLQIIVGFSSMLMEAPLAREQLMDVEEILTAAAHATATTQQLMQFGHYAMHVPEAIDVADVVNQLLPAVPSRSMTRHALQVLTSPTRALSVDPVHLRHMVTNLLDNARAATFAAGEISVIVNQVELPYPALAADGRRMPAGTYAAVAVRDRGTGMTPEVQRHILEPFYTTKPVGQGAGLGLSAVHGLVTQNGGFLTFSSTQGIGSTFMLWFPAPPRLPLSIDGFAADAHSWSAAWRDMDQDEPDAASVLRAWHTERSAPALPMVVQRILVVASKERLLGLVVRSLESVGYEVISARTGSAALQIVEHLGSPVLAMIDESLTGMGAAELSRRLREVQPGQSVIQFTVNSATSAPDCLVIEDDGQQRMTPFSSYSLVRHVQQQLRRMHDNAGNV